MRGRRTIRMLAASAALLACLLLLPAAGAAAPGDVRAGVAVVDASWHVGASAGQYAGDCLDDDTSQAETGQCNFASVHGTDPHAHSIRRVPSYGMQSRLTVRALVVEGADGRRIALVKNEQYIPQDLLWRRTAQILEAGGSRIGRTNLTMMASHNHSSPMYSSTSWGVWAFQDVFDFRFFEYMAQRMARAVEQAASRLVPVRVGASVRQHSFPQRNVPGPQVADDGTPAGYPRNYTDHDLTVVRFDDISDPGRPKPLANLVNYSLHPEFLEGNNLISGDYVAHVERMADRRTGAVNIWSQSAVGTTEPENNEWHNLHERAFFSHREYAQAEHAARGIADRIIDAWRDVERSTPADPDRFVPFQRSFDVAMEDRWFPGPASHPYPGVSSCRTDRALQGDPRAPIVGLPDCTGSPTGGVDQVFDPGVTTDTVQQHGVPVPENYSAPSYTGLEEDVSVHLQAFRLGDILFAVCSCEQWADQSRNIKSRTNERRGDQWNGYDWSEQCTQHGGGWDCPNPQGGRLTVSDAAYRKLRAQVRNNANGWDSLEYVPFAESEPTNPDEIKGNYTHQELQDLPGARPYRLTVAIAMANDYNGYIATYREYQRGDHYRKALTAWGPHSSDYMATRLVRMGAHLSGGPEPDTLTNADQWPGGEQKVAADLAFNDQRAQTIGRIAANGIPAYEASLPDDGGEAEAVKHPESVERFGAAFFTWNGGSNYTDDPQVRVQRLERGRWTDYADQSGELPVTLRFPTPDEGPGYRANGQRWHWTAHFEAFVAPFDPGERPRATPAGVYRFVVDGQRREDGAVRSYRVVSREFGVRPWSGVTVEGLRRESDGAVSFRVGPRLRYDTKAETKCRDLDGDGRADPEPIRGELGPIDYPDSYKSPIAFVRNKRSAFIECADPGRPEWFCFTCSFRPWIDTGNAERAVVTFIGRHGGVHRESATERDGRWVTRSRLGTGEAAYVEAGDVCDHHQNYNGAASATIGNRDATPRSAPAGFSCVPREQTRAGGGGSGGSRSTGFADADNPLGLPSPRTSCVDRRKWRFRIHQPRGGSVIAVNVYVNGKRVLAKRGRRITVIKIRKLPRKRRYVVKIVAITNVGTKVISTRTYRGCRKSRPRTRVRRPPRGRHR